MRVVQQLIFNIVEGGSVDIGRRFVIIRCGDLDGEGWRNKYETFFWFKKKVGLRDVGKLLSSGFKEVVTTAKDNGT